MNVSKELQSHKLSLYVGHLTVAHCLTEIQPEPSSPEDQDVPFPDMKPDCLSWWSVCGLSALNAPTHSLQSLWHML